MYNDADSSRAPQHYEPQHYDFLATLDQPRVRSFSFYASFLLAITFCAGTLVGLYNSSLLPAVVRGTWYVVL